MLDIIEMSDLRQFQMDLPEGREKELLHKLIFEYDQYSQCGTYQDCQSRQEWFSYSLEHIMQNFNKTVAGLREYVEEIRKESDEKLKKNGVDLVVGDTVWSIRCEMRIHGSHYNYAMTTRAKEIPAFSDKCYVAPKKCTKSDKMFIGKTLFLTKEEAEQYLAECRAMKARKE